MCAPPVPSSRRLERSWVGADVAAAICSTTVSGTTAWVARWSAAAARIASVRGTATVTIRAPTLSGAQSAVPRPIEAKKGTPASVTESAS